MDEIAPDTLHCVGVGILVARLGSFENDIQLLHRLIRPLPTQINRFGRNHRPDLRVRRPHLYALIQQLPALARLVVDFGGRVANDGVVDGEVRVFVGGD